MLIRTPSCARSSEEVTDRFVLRWWSAFVAIALFSAQPAWAGTTRVQQISLAKGWNAIYLAVQPADPGVAAVFDPAKVDFVARYFTPTTGVRFIENPAEQAWNTPAWGVWYAPGREESFLTSLHAIDGGCAYLVHATSAHTLSVTGEVRFQPLRWTTDSYNLTGLPVEGATRPTFARFFSGAAGKLGAKVYRLAEGSWQQVTNLAATEVKSGEAYWIYCEGKTNYQGPLDLRFTGGDRLNFSQAANHSVIELANHGTNPYSVQAAIESGGTLPLFRLIPDLTNLNTRTVSLNGGANLGNLNAGGVTQFRLEFRPGMMTEAAGGAVLKFSTSDGVVLRVPVRATLP